MVTFFRLKNSLELIDGILPKTFKTKVLRKMGLKSKVIEQRCKESCHLESANMNIVVWLRIFLASLRRNGPLQLFFYLSNLNASRFIEYSKAADLLETENKGIILDLGAGYSTFQSFIKKRLFNCNCQYVTLDLNRNACKFQAEAKQGNTYQIRCDISYLPIRSTSIQSVIAISSIEHVPNDALVFQEVGRVLKTGGTTVISVPYSRRGSRTITVKRNKKLVHLLNKFRRLWSLLLNKHLNYFVEQTATDSIMKYYDDASITEVMTKNGLPVMESCHYGGEFNNFFKYVPMGWFILKDLFIGLILLKLTKISGIGVNEAKGIIFLAKKSAA